jgi:predicted nucleic acid-binding protein
MAQVLFDTSVYISSLRTKDDVAAHLRQTAGGAPIWLSAVVLEELYAGASGKSEKLVERLERDFDRVKRILVPGLGDWSLAGRVLSRLAAKHDYERIGQARLTNDTLIAASAGRMGITILTSNERDFARLAEFVRFDWRVVP